MPESFSTKMEIPAVYNRYPQQVPHRHKVLNDSLYGIAGAGADSGLVRSATHHEQEQDQAERSATTEPHGQL